MPHASHKSNSKNRTLFSLHVRFLLSIYRTVFWIATPFFILLFKHLGKKNPQWLNFLGLHTTVRPPGPILWIHGASLGELRSGLIFMRHLKAHRPEITLLVTGYEVASIDLIQPYLPTGSLAFLWPLDAPLFVKRF